MKKGSNTTQSNAVKRLGILGEKLCDHILPSMYIYSFYVDRNQHSKTITHFAKKKKENERRCQELFDIKYNNNRIIWNNMSPNMSHNETYAFAPRMCPSLFEMN